MIYNREPIMHTRTHTDHTQTHTALGRFAFERHPPTATGHGVVLSVSIHPSIRYSNQPIAPLTSRSEPRDWFGSGRIVYSKPPSCFGSTANRGLYLHTPPQPYAVRLARLLLPDASFLTCGICFLLLLFASWKIMLFLFASFVWEIF